MRPRSTAGAAVATVAVALAVFPAAAGAATIPVTNDLDESTNGTQCSLREAITSANLNSNAHEDACVAGQPAPAVDTVDLGSTGYELLGSGDNGNVTGDFDINTAGGPVVIAGDLNAGSIATNVDADDLDRIFHVDGGVANPITIRDIILRDGQVTDTAGGTILMADADLTLDNVVVETGRVAGTSASSMRGAGLAAVSAGTLTIRDSDFNDNVISAAAAGAGTALGAGVFVGSDTTAVIDRSSISDNGMAGDGTGVGDAQTLAGAGIATEDAEQDLTVTNSLIAANAAVNGDQQDGGGIRWDESGDDDVLRLTNVTFSANSVGAGRGGGLLAGGDSVVSHATFGPNTAQFGAGLFNIGGPVQVRNSLIETGTTADCGGSEPMTSLGYNIERGPSQDCGFSQPTDQLPDQSLMFALDDNGGPFQTHQVQFAFLDLIPGASCRGADGAPLTRDQRNALRPGQNSGDGTMCDPGAYELNRCGPGTIVEIVGSEGNDQLVGTAGADGIMGMGGNDTVEGSDGVDGACGGDGDDVFDEGFTDGDSDFFRGEGGSDTLDFSLLSDPNTLNLAITTSQETPGTGLGGTSQNTIENVLGGVSADTLTGNAAFNRLLGNAGNDGLFSRDGAADFVDCGPGTGDTAQTDRLSLDTVVNCESVDALPEPPAVAPTTPAATPPPAKKKCKKKKKPQAAAKKCRRKKR